MTFPLGLLLIPYLIAVAGFLIFAILNVFHLITYGATTRTSFIFTFVFLAGTVLIAYASWWALNDINWSSSITINLMSSANIGQF